MTYERACVQFAPLVHKLTRRFRGRDDYEDRVQEGFLGLLRAVDSFHDDGGASFLTWASMWIRCYVVRATHRAVRRGLGGDRRRRDIGDGMLSLDAPVQANDTSLYDVLGVDGGAQDRFADGEERAWLTRSASNMTPRHRAIVAGYVDGQSPAEIGAGLGVSRERVRQILCEVVERVRRDVSTRPFEPAEAIPAPKRGRRKKADAPLVDYKLAMATPPPKPAPRVRRYRAGSIIRHAGRLETLVWWSRHVGRPWQELVARFNAGEDVGDVLRSA
jgi:RNA polymerase sigma factor (sigma-70 family)